jgi:integrase
MAIDKKSYSKTNDAGIKIHKDGIKFWFDFVVEGKRYSRLWSSQKSHSPKDRLKTARRELDRIKDEIIHDNSLSSDVNATVRDYWEKLKIVKGWNDILIRNYDYYFEKHLSKLAKIKIRDVKATQFTSLNVTLKDFAPATRKKAYEILKPLFDLAVEDDLIAKSPIKKGHIPVRKQLEEKKVITDAVNKYKKIYATIHQLFGSDDVVVISDTKSIQCNENPHHRALFLFGFYGRRLQEVLTLQWEDINFETNEYIVRGSNSKVNTDMTFALARDVRDALLEFVDTRGNVFMIKHTKDHYPKIRLISGIEEFTFHWMRNLSVSALSAMGASLGDLTALLGHNDSSTLKKYLSLQRETATRNTNDISAKLLGTNND